MSDEEKNIPKEAEEAAKDVAQKAEGVAKEAAAKMEGAVKETAAKAEDVAKEAEGKDAAAKAQDKAKEAATKVQAAASKPLSEMTKVEKKAAKKAAAKANHHKKAIIVWGVVVVVLVVCGVAFNAWHSKPTFCNDICHSPMDSYVQGYYSGSEVLSSAQHEAAGVTCLDCHVPTISQQVSEGIHWISKSYEVTDNNELSGITATTEVLAQRRTFASYEDSSTFCLKSGCHTTAEMDAVDEEYSDYPPHNNHNSKLDCYNCHRVHEQSVMYCTQCHSGAKVPDGWLSYDEDDTRATKKG